MKLILFIVGLLLLSIFISMPCGCDKKANVIDFGYYQCTKCGLKSSSGEWGPDILNKPCIQCKGSVVKVVKEYPMGGKLETIDPKGGMKHNSGCGCRLCYKHPKDFRDLKQYNWWDFHDTSGQQVYAQGTLPTFGLWRNKNDLRAPHCLKAKFDWKFNNPCTNPYKILSNDPSDVNNIPDFLFPAECNSSGRCRIRGPLEDNIFIV